MAMLERFRLDYEGRMGRNRGPAVFLAALFVVGVVFGALAVRSLDGKDKLELVQYLGTTFQALREAPAGDSAPLLRQSVTSSAKLLTLVWVLGISVVGVLGVMLLALLRGFVTGFSVAFLAAELGTRGVLLALAAHLPHSLLEVPALIIAGAAAMGFAGEVVRLWRERRRADLFYQALAPYSLGMLGTGVLLMGAALVQTFVSPTLIQLTTRLLEGR